MSAAFDLLGVHQHHVVGWLPLEGFRGGTEPLEEVTKCLHDAVAVWLAAPRGLRVFPGRPCCVLERAGRATVAAALDLPDFQRSRRAHRLAPRTRRGRKNREQSGASPFDETPKCLHAVSPRSSVTAVTTFGTKHGPSDCSGSTAKRARNLLAAPVPAAPEGVLRRARGAWRPMRAYRSGGLRRDGGGQINEGAVRRLACAPLPSSAFFRGPAQPRAASPAGWRAPGVAGCSWARSPRPRPRPSPWP
jgi:hypothetical protein